MTTPPPDAPEPPDQNWPPPGYPPYQQPGYPPYPPGHPYDPPTYPGWHSPPRRSSLGYVVGLAAAGAVIQWGINFCAFIMLLVTSNKGHNHAVIVTAAVMLAVIAFGGGLGLIVMRKPWSVGVGLGLIIGWALASILSGGLCTGLNPADYAG